ncbi:Vacuolar protein sorting-associated protein 41 [Maudiozyma exigua]|uniref:Vacuolar protein sorting-associated protein 41 n=1 Tax=Maudiozyma exigua TaxID=34358 RepID=A0A9P7B9Y7_MAUEX|nr:Vacuolar protein sorting-associated protein 41 [Kazachstania exigua]
MNQDNNNHEVHTEEPNGTGHITNYTIKDTTAVDAAGEMPNSNIPNINMKDQAACSTIDQNFNENESLDSEDNKNDLNELQNSNVIKDNDIREEQHGQIDNDAANQKNNTNEVPSVSDNDSNSSSSSELNNETDTESEEDSDEEDDEPPLLTYSRIKKLPMKLFQRDAISACNFHSTIFIFGTHSGMLYFTTSHFEMIDTLKCHRSSILSIYSDGTSFATASIDGTIVTGLVNDIKSENLIAYNFKRPISSVVLDTDYLINKTFISGGMAGELILSQRNWLGNKTDMVLSKGEGPILSINKTEDIIFWFTSTGIHFFDKNTRTALLTVELPTPEDADSNPFEIFKPHVHIPERDRIIIGWMDNIWTFRISVATKNNQDGFMHGNVGSILSSAASSFKGTPDKDVDIEYHFVIPLLIAGIASFKDDQLLCLGYEKQKDSKNEFILKHLPPQLKIFNVIDETEIYNDEIVCKDFEKLSLGDYHLGKHIHEQGDIPPEYYLICTSDAIKIQQLTLLDHFNWFVQKEQYYRAWNIAQYVVDDLETVNVGIKYLEQLTKEKKWTEIGPTLVQIFKGLNEDKKTEHFEAINELFNKQWRKLLHLFMDNKNLAVISEYIPLTLDPTDLIYNDILRYTLEEHETSLFSKFIQHWPIKLIADKDYSQAIPYMINVKDPKTIRILQNEPQLLPQVMHRLMDIILIPTFNNPKLRNVTINNMPITEIEQLFWEPILLIVQNRKNISLKEVINIFKNYAQKHQNIDKLLLGILLRIDSTESDLLKVYENEMIDLFARFDKRSLLKFLKSKTHYNVEKAIGLCSTQEGLYSELIYLWGRVGETKKALSIIADKLNDPALAVEYIKSWGDMDLWDFLIEYTMNKPNFVDKLLNSYDYIGNRYVEVLRGINDDQPIERIVPPIVNTLLETKRSYQVKESILKIVDDDTSKYAKALLKLRTKGKIFDPTVQNGIQT